MKTVLLIRHAKSGTAGYNETDFERKLTESGDEDAKRIAQKIYEANIPIDLMITSTAKRAASTCLHFATVNNIHHSDIIYEEKLYNAPSSIFSSVIKSLDNNIYNVAIFGHNLGISEYANTLLEESMDYDMTPCTVFAVTAAVKNWEDWQDEDKNLLFFERPSEF